MIQKVELRVDEGASSLPGWDNAADMLRHRMEAKGVSQMQFSRDTGLPKSKISEVLAGNKPFSRKMIHTLADYFHVNVGVLAANI